MIKINKFFIMLLLISFIVAQLFGGILAYYTFYSFLFIFLIGFVYIILQKKLIHAEVKLENKMYFSGDDIECLTEVKCSSAIAAPFVFVRSQSFLEDLNSYLGEYTNLTLEEDKWIRNSIRFYHRGIYDFGSVYIKVKDTFQVFEVNKKIDCNVCVKVYPKKYQLRKLSISGRDIFQDALDIKSNNEDLFTIRDVRKYCEGDSLKKIHWKVSAKHGELYVKNSDSISGEEFTIFLDMSKKNLTLDEHGEKEEAMVDLCVSMVSYMIQKGIAVKLFVNCNMGQSMIISTKEQLEHLNEFFIIQKSDGEMRFSEFLLDNFNKLHKNNGIAIITGEIQTDLCESLAKIKNYGYIITYFYSLIMETSKQNLDTLKSLGIDCLSVENILKLAKDR